MTKNYDEKHPLVLFERARKMIGHKCLIPEAHYRTVIRQFDSGDGVAHTLMTYASLLHVERADLLENGVDPDDDRMQVDLTLPTVDVANYRIETDVCCPECRVGIAYIRRSRSGKPTWIFQTALMSCGCFDELDGKGADELESLHDKLHNFEPDIT